ncbi:hypothetical protein BIV57_04160 [Mangrovactinospora gilvigrisea]|uniref:NB-ARC domain-containing protein n=1 Tax=Mangrovactinospora gilvigrisea TaxID=1428644 RepID=A0A1J7CGF6_9ACTN|nr:tetratricopeptide repeat protein [Mangrovactinospora gilvigrisea]OIV38746.1 hypothetical protein BIV57_04160 [Mangrovactinospora gilvigrisea]
MIDQQCAMPDPDQADTLTEFVTLLGDLRAWAGGPSYRILAKRIGPMMKPPRIVAPSTVVDAFRSGRRRLDLDLVIAIVRALGGDGPMVAHWRAACLRVHAQAQATGRPTVLQQLPRDLPTFTGRHEALRRLMAAAASTGSDSGAATVLVVEGTAGIGKTQLVLHAAHALLRSGRCSDAQLYVNLRGFDPERAPMDPSDVLEVFLRALGVPGPRLPAGVEERAAMFRDRMTGRNALIVLDNAANEEQITDLIPADPGCTVLVTSRRSLAGLDGSTPLILDAFSTDEALQLLAVIAGQERIAAEPDAARKVAHLCGRHPLALALAAAQLRSRPTWPLAALADRLTAGGTDAVTAGNRALRPVLDLSYNALHPPAQRMFRLLGLHPGDTFTVEAAASLAATDPAEAENLLWQLLDEHLLKATSQDRYEIHDLLRRYAADQQATHSASDHQAARQRLRDHYLHTAHQAARTQFPHRDPILIPLPKPPTATTPITDAATAAAWFDAESAVLHHLTATAVDTDPAASWQLAWTLIGHLIKTSRFQQLLEQQTLALQAASRLGHRRAQAYALERRADSKVRLDDVDGAKADFQQVIAIDEELGDHQHKARALNGLAEARSQCGDHAGCETYARQALEVYQTRQVDCEAGRAQSLNLIGWSMMHLGRADEAVEVCRDSLAIFEQIDDLWGRATVLDSLARAYRTLDRYPEAISTYRDALDLRLQFDAPELTAKTLLYLGDLHQDLGDLAAARKSFEWALSQARETSPFLTGKARQRLADLPQGAPPGRQEVAVG